VVYDVDIVERERLSFERVDGDGFGQSGGEWKVAIL
jgi:hypothetical protein